MLINVECFHAIGEIYGEKVRICVVKATNIPLTSCKITLVPGVAQAEWQNVPIATHTSSRYGGIASPKDCIEQESGKSPWRWSERLNRVF